MAKPALSNASARPGDVFTRDYKLDVTARAWLQAAVIALVTLWIYSPAMNGDWLWDDAMYLTHNRLLDQPDRVWKAWFEPGSFIEYYPLQQTLQWIQWRLWGDNPLPYHLTNIALHILNVLLVWRLLARLGVKIAWVGGLLFAAHPANVESVAWVAEFKNCLALAPALLAMTAWVDYEARGSLRDYRLALGCFVASMLCKITMTMFPFVILLFAWWKRGRIGWHDLRAAAPFFAVSLVLAAATEIASHLYMHHIRSVYAAVPIGGPLAHLALVGTTLAFYFGAFFLPLTLLPVYPQWTVNPPSPFDLLPWLAFGAAFAWLWTKRAGWGRHALLGLGFFFVNLLPFSGLHGISYMSFTWVMDHFLYLPAIGLVALVAAALGDIDERLAVRSRVLGTALITLIAGLLIFRAHWYADAFTNAETLWSYTVERSPGSWMAQSGLGKVLLDEGDPVRAIPHLAEAVAENPGLAEAHTDLGNALAQAGQTGPGVAELERALELDPYDPNANNNLGIVLARQGKIPAAMAHFITSLRAHPDDPEAYSNMGNAFLAAGKADLAAGWYVQSLRVDPRYPEGHYNLGCVRLQQGRLEEAAAQFAQAVELRPGYLEARNNLGTALARLGRTDEAMAQFEQVLQMDPANATAQANLLQLRPGAPK